MSNTEATYETDSGFELTVRGDVYCERRPYRGSVGYCEAAVDEVTLTVDGVTYDLARCSYVDLENEARVSLADIREDDLTEALCEAYREDVAEGYVNAHT